MFLFKNDVDFFQKCGFLKNDSNRLYLEFENFSMEQIEEYLDHNKNEEESVFVKILIK